MDSDKNPMKVTDFSQAGAQALAGWEVEWVRPTVESEFTVDHDGNPKGGQTRGEGFYVDWQSGVTRPHGATLEDVLEGCIQRLVFFQNSRFSCAENADAIAYMRAAVHRLNDRTAARAERGVEGTYNP